MIINRIILLIKNIINNKKTKMIISPDVNGESLEIKNKNFKSNLKLKGKGEIETLVCAGDGTGIQNNISF